MAVVLGVAVAEHVMSVLIPRHPYLGRCKKRLHRQDKGPQAGQRSAGFHDFQDGLLGAGRPPPARTDMFSSLQCWTVNLSPLALARSSARMARLVVLLGVDMALRAKELSTNPLVQEPWALGPEGPKA